MLTNTPLRKSHNLGTAGISTEMYLRLKLVVLTSKFLSLYDIWVAYRLWGVLDDLMP